MTTDAVPLIPRRVLFGNADRTGVQISPDGAWLSWLAPVDGVLNVWIAPRGDLGAARAVTADKMRGIQRYFWAQDNAHLLYMQDGNGDENWRLYALEIKTGNVRDLTPFAGVQVQILATSLHRPAEIVVGINRRDPRWHDVYGLNIATGAMRTILEHTRFAEVVVDESHAARLGMESTPDGGVKIFRRDGAQWRPWEEIGAVDVMTTGPLGFDESGQKLFMNESRGRNTAAVVEVDLASGTRRVLAADDRADATQVLRHPVKRTVQAVRFEYERKRWEIVDEEVKGDFAYLRTVAPGDVRIEGQSNDLCFWVVAFEVDNGPVRYYLYDRAAKHAAFLFADRAALESLELAQMRSVVIKARDGLDLVAYYTLPVGTDANGDGIPDRPLPTILAPHGGPWWRDYWGFHQSDQWLANRGYAVLKVNFRASTGYGKAFVNAGDREWGGKIIEDQLDAVQWAIDAGIADPEKVAVMGGSFGGFSTLAGLGMHPEVFACGVALMGVANLITWMEAVPEYWKPMLSMLRARVGDERTEEGRALLKRHSPTTYVDKMTKPLLIAHGANDVRVRQAESDQVVAGLTGRGVAVKYVVYADEGHGMTRPENSLSYHALAEEFLGRWLGGRVEPVGRDMDGSSAQVVLDKP